MATTDLTIPTLHLNGSGFKNLYEQYTGALSAITKALDSLPVPHGRDYYVVEGAYEKARTQYDAQVAKLKALEAELMTVLEQIVEQEDRRR